MLDRQRESKSVFWLIQLEKKCSLRVRYISRRKSTTKTKTKLNCNRIGEGDSDVVSCVLVCWCVDVFVLRIYTCLMCRNRYKFGNRMQ